MNRKVKHYSVLALGYLLVVSLMIMGQESEVSASYVLLLLPLILLAGTLEFTIGALLLAVASALALVTGHLLQWLPQSGAVAGIISVGLMTGFVALISQDRDVRIKAETQIREPKAHELLKVERKAFMIRRQIEGYKERLDGLIKLYQVAKKLSGVIKLETMLDEARLEVAQLLAQHFSANSDEDARLAFYIPGEESSDFLRVGLRGHEISDEGFPDQLPVLELKRWLGDSFGAVRIKDLASDPRFEEFSRNSHFRSLLAIPLVVHDIVIGLMLLGTSQPGSFSPADFTQAEVLGKQIVFALRKALLYRKVQTLSFTDSQTGLYVHRYFQERLREEVHRAERYHHHLALIMLDLDHFKRVNDEHGHQVGDAVLVEVAARIQEMAGTTALVARYGGEEFAVLLPNTTEARATLVAQSINTFLKATPVDVGGLKLTITISAGVSTYPESALSRDSLIATADAALYQAKNDGRDLVRVFKEDSPKKS